MHKLIILFRSLYGYLLKWLYDMHLLRVPALGEKDQADIIVSLTSYGRRVQKGVVCYSVYSILRQTLQPQRIILWLSKTEWNDTNMPPRVAALRNKGVEIRYCENMRSYTKLLPTLFLNPKESIVCAIGRLHFNILHTFIWGKGNLFIGLAIFFNHILFP